MQRAKPWVIALTLGLIVGVIGVVYFNYHAIHRASTSPCNRSRCS